MNKENIIRSGNYQLIADFLSIDKVKVKNYFNYKAIKRDITNPEDVRVFVEKYLMKRQGIYIIENSVNHKKYIGSSRDVYERKLVHFQSMKSGTHKNKGLQYDFNKYGEEVFIFSVVSFEENEEEMRKKERTIISQYDSESLYNVDCVNKFFLSNVSDVSFIRSCLANREAVEKYIKSLGQK